MAVSGERLFGGHDADELAPLTRRLAQLAERIVIGFVPSTLYGALPAVIRAFREAAPHIVFVDLPGYGYAKISKSISAGWPAFIEPYLAERETLGLCICLIDSNIPPQPSDRQLIDWLRAANRRFAVVATKVDRLSGNERTRNLDALKKGLELDEVLPVSSKTRHGINELWSRIENLSTSA